MATPPWSWSLELGEVWGICLSACWTAEAVLPRAGVCPRPSCLPRCPRASHGETRGPSASRLLPNHERFALHAHTRPRRLSPGLEVGVPSREGEKLLQEGKVFLPSGFEWL